MKRISTSFVATLALALAACGGSGKSAAPTTPGPTEPAPAPAAPAPATPAPTASAPAPEAPLPDLAFPADEFRQKQPTATALREPQLPKAQQFKLKNGVQVYLVEEHKLPTITLSLAFEGGSLDDPPGKEGLARVCAATLGDSTEKLDTVAFAEAQADMASSVNVGAGDDQQNVDLRTLTRNLDATADLWADVLLRPGLRQSDFDRNVQRARASLRQQKGSPNGVLGLLSGSILYGEAHPRGRFVSEASLGAITLDDCKAYAKDWFKPTGARLWVAGDITKAQVIALADRVLKDWKGKGKTAIKPTKPVTRKGRVFFVDVPGAAQSAIWMGEFGPGRKAPEYFASTIAASILGGGFSGRINMNLREKNGYAYGAYGGFGYNRDYGTFTASASVRSDVTDKALVELYGEISRILTGDITDEELKREKNGLVFSLPARFETSGGTLATFRGLAYFGLPLDYYGKFVKNVSAVDKKAAVAAAKKNLKPKDLVIFVVGDASVVLPGLQKLHADKAFGEGDLVILDVDGKVVGNR
jgi:zinc protease